MKTAQDYASAIFENVKGFTEGKIKVGLFHKNQLALWGAVNDAGLRKEVTRLVKPALFSIKAV